jgi:hypothetical protein
MLPIDPHLSEFLHAMDSVSGDRGMHLEVRDGVLVAIDDRPGIDPVQVAWDDDLKSYQVVTQE